MEEQIAQNVTLITQLFQWVVGYVDTVVGGNEFASGLLLTGIAGAGMYALRTVPMRIYQFLMKHLSVTLVLHSSAESFHKFSRYCERKGLVKQSRYLKFNNGVNGYDDTVKELGLGTQILWVGFIPLLISREEMSSDSRQAKEIITIKKIGRSHKYFDELFEEISRDEDEIVGTKVYEMEGDYKSYITKQPHRRMETIAIPDDELSALLAAIDRFRDSEQWYIDHGIPYQLGIMLYGPPGTGKTSLVKAIATYLDMDIVIANDATKLISACKNCRNSVIACEELDTFGMGQRDLEDDDEDLETKNKEVIEQVAGVDRDMAMKISAKSDKASTFSKMMLSEVLNALDGIVMSHGRVMVFTTNDPDAFDPALMRPGRIDLKVHVGYLNEETFNKMIRLFFKDHKYRKIDIRDSVTPAELQNDIRLGLTVDDLFRKYSKDHDDKYQHEYERFEKVQGYRSREPVNS